MCAENNVERNTNAVFVYLFYEDLFEKSLKQLTNIPNNCDIYIATNTERKLVSLKKKVDRILLDKNVYLHIHVGKGRDVSALLVLFNNYCLKYEVICFIHDKKSSQMKYESVGRDFNNHIWESLIGSEEQVKNILNSFRDEKHLGLLVPSMVSHGEYFHTAIDLWTVCYDGTVELAEKLGLDVIIKGDKNPVSVGTAFWARTIALKKLFEFDFSYEMFPDEPFPIDGSISHCIERIFPYVALDAGYYTGIVYSKDIASNSLLNQSYELNKILKKLDQIEGINTATLKTTLESLDNVGFRKKDIDATFIDNRLIKRKDELIKEFKEKYDDNLTYRWVFDQIINARETSSHKFLRSFKYSLSKKIRTELCLYRYYLIDVMLDAIEDYLEGQTYHRTKYKKYDIKLMLDIDMDWYYQCSQIDDCDLLHMLVRKLSLNGYLLQANRNPIVGMDNLRAVQGYRAREITFWDSKTRCGFVCKKDFIRAWKLYWRSKKVFFTLSLNYKRISDIVNSF